MKESPEWSSCYLETHLSENYEMKWYPFQDVISVIAKMQNVMVNDKLYCFICLTDHNSFNIGSFLDLFSSNELQKPTIEFGHNVIH